MRYFFLLSILGFLSFPSFCQKQQTWVIDPYKHPCVAEGRHLCMSYTDEKGEAHSFYDGIEGFKYEWGKVVKLSLHSRIIEQPMADGASIAYRLDKIISIDQVPDGTEFSMDVDQGDEYYGFGEMIVLVKGVYTLMWDVEIIHDQKLEELIEMLEISPLRVTFSHQSGKVKVEYFTRTAR